MGCKVVKSIRQFTNRLSCRYILTGEGLALPVSEVRRDRSPEAASKYRVKQEITAIALIKVRRLRFENLELEMACRVGQSAAAGQRQ